MGENSVFPSFALLSVPVTLVCRGVCAIMLSTTMHRCFMSVSSPESHELLICQCLSMIYKDCCLLDLKSIFLENKNQKNNSVLRVLLTEVSLLLVTSY